MMNLYYPYWIDSNGWSVLHLGSQLHLMENIALWGRYGCVPPARVVRRCHSVWQCLHAAILIQGHQPFQCIPPHAEISGNSCFFRLNSAGCEIPRRTEQQESSSRELTCGHFLVAWSWWNPLTAWKGTYSCFLHDRLRRLSIYGTKTTVYPFFLAIPIARTNMNHVKHA